MNDQCKNCTLRGDYDACIEAECFIRENWFAQQQAERIKELEARIGDLEEQVVSLGVSNLRIRDAAEEVTGWGDNFHGFSDADLDDVASDIAALRKALEETPAQSLAAVRREAMEEMREKIAGALIDANMPGMTHAQIAQTIREVKIDD